MGLIDRAKNIIMRPKQEWPVIDTEPATVGGLYSGYIAPLAALPVIALILKYSFFGLPGTYTSHLIGFAIAQYVIGLIVIYLVALVIDALAPSFGGTKSVIQALKVTAYSYTAAWVLGVFILLPWLGWLIALFGLFYSLYLLYTGLPVLMKSPPDKSAGYAIVVIIAAIILYMIGGTIASRLFGFGAGPFM